MFCAFAGAGIGNFVRCKLGKHHFTLFLCIFASVTSACLVYAGLFEVMKLILGVSEQHEAGYICSMLWQKTIRQELPRRGKSDTMGK